MTGTPRMTHRAQVVVASYSIGGKRVMVQVTGLYNDTKTALELMQPYGRSAMPARGADVVVHNVNDSEHHQVAYAADNPALRIPDLKPGEFGDRGLGNVQIVFRADHLEITSPTLPVRVTAPTIQIGAAGATLHTLMTQVALGILATHTHGGGHQMDQSLDVIEALTTALTAA